MFVLNYQILKSMKLFRFLKSVSTNNQLELLFGRVICLYKLQLCKMAFGLTTYYFMLTAK